MPANVEFENFDLVGLLTGSTELLAGRATASAAAPQAMGGQPPPHLLSSSEAFRHAAALHDAGKFAEAETLLREATARDPSSSDLRNARGVMFARRDLDALWCYRDTIACKAFAAAIWTNLGNALTKLRHLKSATACHQRALALSDGREPLFRQNLGTALAEAGRHGEAVVAFSKAIALDPKRLMVQWDRGRSYLYLGNYRQAWPDYEVRRFTGQLPPKKLPGEAWAGQPYAGKRLVLIVEQGFGDTLWVAICAACLGCSPSISPPSRPRRCSPRRGSASQNSSRCSTRRAGG
jgi:Flp pilus assembly protein TadD